MIKFFVRRPAVVWLITITIVVVGIHSFLKLPVAMFPEFSLNQLWVATIYPGTSPQEMEQQVTAKLEEELKEVRDVKWIESASVEGASLIIVQFEDYVKDMSDARRQVQDALDRVQDLPEELPEKPRIYEIETGQMPVVMLALSADVEEKELRKLADELSDRIEEIPDVSQTTFFGIRDRELKISVDVHRLNAYGLSFSDIASAIGRRHLNVPAGTLKEGRQEYVVRIQGEPKDPHQLANVVVRAREGSLVRVGDVARIEDSFVEPRIVSHLNGRPCGLISILKRPQANALNVVRRIQALLSEMRPHLPPSMEVAFVFDSTRYIHRRLSELVQNGLWGFVLVFLILLVVMEFRRALFVAAGIPIAILICFFLMSVMGMSLNIATIFAFVLVLGMEVDDCIVISENMTRLQEEGMPPRRAAVVGAREVIIPVLNSHATTIAAFLPLLLITGVIGKFVKYIPLVVTFMLLASLFEAVVCLPSHLADFCPPPPPREQGGWRTKLILRMQAAYEKALRWCLRRKWLCLSAPFVGLTITLVLVKLGFLPIVLFPPEEPDQIFVNYELAPGTKLDETVRVMRELERRILERKKELHDIENVIAVAGAGVQWDYTRAKNVGQITLELIDLRERRFKAVELIERLQKLLGDVPGLEKLIVTFQRPGPPVRRAISIRLIGEEWAVLEEIAGQVKDFLRTQKGVINIEDDRSYGDPEIRISVDEDKARLCGLDFFTIAWQVRAAFAGHKASVRREGEEEFDIVVRGQEDSYKNKEALYNLTVFSPTGAAVPLRSVASITESPGYAAINRRNFKHMVRVEADVDPRYNTTYRVNRAVEAEFKDISMRYPGYRIEYGGEQEQLLAAFSDLWLAFLVALIMILALLLIEFNSLFQAFIILLTIPLSAFGVAMGLLLTRNPASFTALIGAVALAGIVVNNAIVFIDFINRYRSQYPNRDEALIAAGKVRMRPILLTSITTILGLLPNAVGFPVKSMIWSPMANTMCWGLAVATVGTLLLIPAAYIVMDDLSQKVVSFFRKGGMFPEEDVSDL